MNLPLLTQTGTGVSSWFASPIRAKALLLVPPGVLLGGAMPMVAFLPRNVRAAALTKDPIAQSYELTRVPNTGEVASAANRPAPSTRETRDEIRRLCNHFERNDGDFKANDAGERLEGNPPV